MHTCTDSSLQDLSTCKRKRAEEQCLLLLQVLSILKTWGCRNIGHTILTTHWGLIHILLRALHHAAIHSSYQAFLHFTHKAYTARHSAVQILSTRKRKDVEVADIKVQVCLYAFDCLYQNGEVLVDRPLTERREVLYNSLSEKEGELLFAEAKVSPPAL